MKGLYFIVVISFIIPGIAMAELAATPPAQAVTTSQTTSAPAQTLKINLNTASPRELMKVSSINASRARAILRYRKKHGAFKTIAELKTIKVFKRLNTAQWQEIEAVLAVN